MPDVGVLNLQIQENSESAIRGLDNLVGALERVKNAVSGGLKLSPVATGLKKIGQVVDENIHGSTIAKLGELADQLSKLNGLGNINIKITGNGAVESMRDSVREARDSMGGINTGFDEIGARAYSAKGSMEGFNSTVRDTASLMQNRAWTAGVEEFRRLFEEMSRLRMMFSLPAGTETGMSTQVEQGWTSWKNGAIEVEGTVSDAMDRVTARLGEPIPFLTDTASQLGNINSYLGRTNDLMEEFARNTSAMSSGENAIIPYTGGQTELEEGLERIEEQANNTRDAIETMGKVAKEYVNSDYMPDTKDYSLNGWGKTPPTPRMNVESEREAIDYVDELINRSSDVDLLNMKIEALRDKLVDGVNSGKMTGDQIAKTVEKIRELNDAVEEAERSIFSFKGTLEGIKKGINNLGITKLVKQFARLAKTRMLRAAIKQISAGFREGVENVYNYSKAIKSSFAPSLDNAVSSLQTMKNSIGAAAAPLIQAIVPHLQTLINWFIEAINYLNQFFALLRGQTTWTRALPATANAFDKQTKAAKKTGNAIKDLLADWDELNIIQSQTSGSGVGTDTAEDYLKMFEEVSKFDKTIKSIADFISDHLEKTKAAILDIGAALLAWKLSSGFTGWLSTLATIATIGFIIKLSFDATTLLDEAYVESDNIGFLVGDMALTGALAGIAGKLAEAKFGEGAGLITAGMVFSVSAGATFAVAEGVEEDSKREMLNLLGAVKLGIAGALTIAGFIESGVNPVLSIVGGVLSVGLVAAITYGLEIKAEEAKKAEEMAKEAFAATGGEGGINAQNYLDALQKEFDAQTTGAKLVLKAYVEVPDLKDKLTEAASQISSFNTIIFKGEGKLSKEDAEEFKKNWGIVIETLKSMDTVAYNTILQGLTAALQTKSDELRATALEIRKTFIMIEKNITAENASIYAEMEDIAGRLGTEAEKAGDLERYETLYHVFAASTETGFSEIQKALDKGKTIDFGNADTAVENATEFVKSVGESGNAALKEVQDSLDAITESVEYKRRIETAKYEAGLIGEEEYLSRMTAFDQILQVATDYAEEKTKAIREKMDEAYKVVLEQALSSNTGTTEYWKAVMIPLIQQAKEAGVTVPQTVIDAFTDSINGARLDFGLPGDSLVKKIKEQGITTPGAIADAIKQSISSEFGSQESDLEYLITNFFVSHSQAMNLDETMMQAKNLMGLSGWDLLSKQWKQNYVDALMYAYGADTTREILAQLTTNTEEIEKLIDGTLYDGKEKPDPVDMPGVDNTGFNKDTNDAAASAEDMARRIRAAFQSLDGLGFNLDLTDTSGKMTVTIPPIQQAATGAFVRSGDLVMANENGNFEMMGRMGNQPVIANNKQIVEGITNGVSNANGDVVSELRGLSGLMRQMLNNGLVAKVVPSSTMGRNNNRSAEAYDRVTG